MLLYPQDFFDKSGLESVLTDLTDNFRASQVYSVHMIQISSQSGQVKVRFQVRPQGGAALTVTD